MSSRAGWRRMAGVAAAVAVLNFSAGAVVAQETIQRATEQAIGNAVDGLAGTSFEGVTNVAVLPLMNDGDGYATATLRSGVTKTDYELFTREDEQWDDLLAEIEWGVRREDVMNPETVQRFGRIEGVDAVMWGTIWDRSENMWNTRARTKLSVELAEVETGRVLWSSGPVEGTAYIHWSDAITQFWRYPLLLIGGIVVLIVLVLILRAVLRGLRRATRPL